MTSQSPLLRRGSKYPTGNDAATEPSATDLAAAVKAFRAREGCNVARAAELLGIPARTIEGIEQGRGYRHPMLILLALRSFD